MSQEDNERPHLAFWLEEPEEDESEQSDKPATTGDDPRSESFSELENDLEDEKDGRREERFIFILIIVTLLNVTFLGSMSNWTAPLIVGAGEALLLFIAAKRWGLKEIVIWIDQWTSRFTGKDKKD